MPEEPKPGGTTQTPPAAAPTSIAGATPAPAAALKPGDAGYVEPGKETPAPDPAAAAAAAVKPGEKDASKPDAKKAPEKYELQLPEGGRIDSNDLAAVEQLARDNDWTKDEAQDHLDAIAESVDAQAARWLTETTADKDYGGDKLATTQKLAMQAVSKIRPEGHPRRASFLAFMNRGGAGNHLEVVSFLADLGKLMAEDSPNLGTGGGGAQPTDAATKLYGPEKK